MPFTMNTIQVDSSGLGATYVRANLVSSGNYVTGGDALDMTALAIAAGCDQSPTDVAVESIAGTGDEYSPVENAAPTFANWLLKCRTAAGVEFTGGAAYPTDTLRINVIFNKLL